MIWPKLFRRIVPYLTAGNTTFDGFDAWLRADPVHRDDRLLLLSPIESGNMHDVVAAGGNQIQLTRWPEDFVIEPDPPASGATTGRRRYAAGDVVIVAAVPDPVGDCAIGIFNENGPPSRRVLVVPRCRTVVSIQTAAAG